MTGRVLPHRVASGASQMALDEALLESAEGQGTAIVRTYEWAEPTLSLGYFQPFAAVEADARWRNAAVVRRPTGGGAIWHDHDLTYAVVLPRAHRLSREPRSLYLTVHQALVEWLRALGAAVSVRGDAPKPAARPFLCFEDRDPEDVVLGGGKVIGSAQRRRHGAVLQHGSLLLARSATVPELAGLRELAALEASPGPWSRAIGDRLIAALGLHARPDDLTGAEAARADELESRVYGRDDWARRR